MFESIQCESKQTYNKLKKQGFTNNFNFEASKDCKILIEIKSMYEQLLIQPLRYNSLKTIFPTDIASIIDSFLPKNMSQISKLMQTEILENISSDTIQQQISPL